MTALPTSTGKNFIPVDLRPDVTDHAVLRYLERALGYDIEGTRRTIASLVGPAVALGATAFAAGGVTFKLDENRVVTVLPIEKPHHGPKRAAPPPPADLDARQARRRRNRR